MISTNQEHPAKIGARNFSSQELGVWVGISSFGMLFGTFLLSYLLAKSRFPVWPPVGVDPISVFIPTLSTLSLLMSSFFIHKAVTQWELRHRDVFKKFWALGIVLGFVFLAFQVAMWKELIAQGLNAQDHLYGGAVYTLTGLHALHVVGGLLGLFWIAVKTQNPRRLSETSEAPKLVGLIWHFLDFVWVIMFLVMVVF